MKFESTYTSKAHRYGLGVETESGRHYAAIPVSNRMVDYAEYYKIDDDMYEAFLSDQGQAIEFVESCRRCEHDDRLFMQPGTDRGTPR